MAAEDADLVDRLRRPAIPQLGRPVGWLGADGDGEMMVALRCGLVQASQATLFAGCGIVADSDPAREWEESRLKLRTMLLALAGEAPGSEAGRDAPGVDEPCAQDGEP